MSSLFVVSWTVTVMGYSGGSSGACALCSSVDLGKCSCCSCVVLMSTCSGYYDYLDKILVRVLPT